MKIAFDGKRYFKNHTGLGNYSRNLIQNLAIHFPSNEYHILANNTKASPFNSPSNSSMHDPQKKLGSLWRSRGIATDINEINPHIYHGLSNELPTNANSIKALKVVTIHDLFFHFYPKDFGFLDRKIYRSKTVNACKNADHIIAISNSTKQDLVEILGLNPKKITVIPQTCNILFQQNLIDDSPFSMSHLPEEFALFVGSLNHRKNILGLIQALSILPKEDQIPLLLVGSGSSAFVSMLKRKIKEKHVSHLVKLMGPLPNEDLAKLYRKARFTCLISFYEGFGIPIIESLFCNTPVLISNSSSLPEAAGGCGIQCNPDDIADISHKLQLLIKDDKIINELGRSIPSHITQFTSVSTATRLNSFYFSGIN